MEDLTGRSRFSRNLIVYWVAELLVLAVGFIVPRQISDHLGMEALGVWDLGWATFRFLAMTGIGAVGVNRYIALYRASGDVDAQSRLYTSSLHLQLLVSVFLVIVTAILTMSAAHLDISGFQTREVRSIVFLFCLAVIAKLLGDPSRGVLTGAHRWDVHHTINVSQDLGIAAALVIGLPLGADLVDLGIIVLIFSCATTILRIVIKNRLCPEIKFRLIPWDIKTVMRLVRFGAKSLSNTSSQLILFQTIAITIGIASGPAALAIFSRSQTLVRISDSLIQKVAYMLMPIASSFVGLKREDEARTLLLDSCILFMCASIPISAVLIFFGDMVVHIWMGEEYVNRNLIVIFALGALLPIGNAGAYGVLSGLDAHGKVGIASLIVTIVGLGVLIPVVHIFYEMEYLSAAVIVAVLWTASRGIVIPVFLKYRFGITFTRYIFNALLKPTVFFLPMFALLWFAREATLTGAYISAVAMLLFAFVLTMLLVWHFVLPDSIRGLVVKKYQKPLK